MFPVHWGVRFTGIAQQIEVGTGCVIGDFAPAQFDNARAMLVGLTLSQLMCATSVRVSSMTSSEGAMDALMGG